MPCFFDIETDGLHDGARITCAATSNDNGVIAWHSKYSDYMTIADLNELVNFLCEQDIVVTYNGANFDFRVLYFCTLDPRVISLAKHHIDICHCFAANKGYYTSLDSFMRGCGIPGKSGSGGDAIKLWLEGNKTQKQGILDYCKNDVRCLKDLYIKMINPRAKIFRESKRGKKQRWRPKLQTVLNATQDYLLRPPDVSWMTNPPKIDSALDWSFTIPKLAQDQYSRVLPDTVLCRCARMSRSLEEFDAAVAEEVYARF